MVEKRTFRLPGFLMLLILLGSITAAVWYLATQDVTEDNKAIVITVLSLVWVLIISGFVVLSPNEARVIQFFGRYIGSVKKAGFHWVTPLTSKRKVSLRVRNFETARLKVSDA